MGMDINFGLGGLEADFWRMSFLMTRIGAAMFSAPLFGASGVPSQVRVAISAAIAIFVSVWLPVATPDDLFSLNGFLIIAGEVVIGLSLGFALQIAFAAPIVAAEMIGGAMGLSMAVTSDPNSGAQVSAFGQYFTVVLTLIFLAIGGHLLWLELLIESFTAFPPGEAWLAVGKFDAMARFGSSMFATGVAIALPITLVLLLVQVVTGILSRSAPQLNIFALGLPAGVMAGIGALIIASPMIFSGLESVAEMALEQAESVIR